MFFNAHTHQQDDLHIGIQNKYPNETPAETYYSCGIHPWYADNWTDQINDLEKHLKNTPCVAIGECGLDKLSKVDLDTQIECFEAQLTLASKYNLSVIIHCVKSYDVLLGLLKKIKPQVPLVFHGFNQNIAIIKQLEPYNFYLSFGKSLLIESSNAAKALLSLKKGNYFLETDSDSELSIEDVYQKAAELLNLPIEKIKGNILINSKAVFHVEF